MDDSLVFRNVMASKGTEYTPEEAQRVIKSVEKFQSEMDRISIEDPQHFDRLRNLTFADKQRLCREFAEKGQEVTPDEIDGLIGLILYSQFGDEVDDWR